MISIIIPAHNSAKTLEAAVDSVVSQMKNQADVEVVIVENSSQDNTFEVAQTLQAKYPNVIKTAQSAPGVSNSRNLGMEIAEGEFYFFLDADDKLAMGALGSLVEVTKDSSDDLYIFSYMVGINQISLTKEKVRYTEETVLELKKEMLANPTRWMTVWSKLFKRELIMKNKLRFATDLYVAEDGDFMLRYLKYCNSVTVFPNTSYIYSLNTTSTMRTYDGTKVRGYLTALESGKKFVDNEMSELNRAYNLYILIHLNIMMVREVYSNANNQTNRERRITFKKILKEKVIKDALANSTIGELASPRLLPALLIKLRLSFLAPILFNVRVWQNSRKETN